jgi:hypothetical protein
LQDPTEFLRRLREPSVGRVIELIQEEQTPNENEDDEADEEQHQADDQMPRTVQEQDQPPSRSLPRYKRCDNECEGENGEGLKDDPTHEPFSERILVERVLDDEPEKPDRSAENYWQRQEQKSWPEVIDMALNVGEDALAALFRPASAAGRDRRRIDTGVGRDVFIEAKHRY